MTQEAAAALAQLAPRHLQRAEAGVANLCLASLIKLATAYRVAVHDLFDPTWEGEVAGRFAAEPSEP